MMLHCSFIMMNGKTDSKRETECNVYRNFPVLAKVLQTQCKGDIKKKKKKRKKNQKKKIEI